jgi:hypothetical protein
VSGNEPCGGVDVGTVVGVAGPESESSVPGGATVVERSVEVGEVVEVGDTAAIVVLGSISRLRRRVRSESLVKPCSLSSPG